MYYTECMAVDHEAVKKRIYWAALPVFVKQGYKGATMRKLAQAAGMPLATMQYYYRRKIDIFLDLANTAQADTMRFMQKLSQPVIHEGQIDRQYITELTKTLYDHVTRNHRVIVMNLHHSKGTPFEERTQQLVSATRDIIFGIIHQLSQGTVTVDHYLKKEMEVMARMVIELTAVVAEHYEPGEWVYDILHKGIHGTVMAIEDLARH